MAKRTTEAYISQMEKTSAYWKKKADREYAYAKNSNDGYHYGYARDGDGNIDFSKSLSSEEYKKIYQKEIDIFNKSINKTRIIVDMIDRFIVRGRNSDYK